MNDDDGKHYSASSAANLPDDVVVDILSRLPLRPLCCCKCVSRAWRDLISHPDHRRRLAQTVSGFFYHLHVDDDSVVVSPPPEPCYWRFTAASSPFGSPHPFAAAAASFPFLPSSYSRPDTDLLDSCNGLLLLRSQRRPATTCCYVVCNPATGNWVELPQPIHPPGTFGLRSDYLDGKRRTRLAALAFDPAGAGGAARFHVMQLVEKEQYYPFHFQYRFVIDAVEIYSSETNTWAVTLSHITEITVHHVTCAAQQATYHDGALHLAVDDGGVMSVPTAEGQPWRVTRVFPEPERHATCGAGAGGGLIGRSRGRLLYVHRGSRYASLSVYALESIVWPGAGERWTLQHYASALDQFGQTLFKEHYGVVAVHPDGNVVFLFDSCRGILLAYDMDRRTVRDVQPLVQASRYYPFFPYVPLYSTEALSSG